MPRPASDALLDALREDYQLSGRRIVGGVQYTKREDGEDRLDVMWVWICEEPGYGGQG